MIQSGHSEGTRGSLTLAAASNQVVESGDRLAREGDCRGYQSYRGAEQNILQPLCQQVGGAVRIKKRQVVGERARLVPYVEGIDWHGDAE